MSVLRQLEAVPAYFATDAENHRVPFIVSLLLRDREGRPRITPAVEAAIDRTVEITGRDGLVTAIVSEQDEINSVKRIVRRSMAIDGAILLFRCQNAETAEALMRCLDDLFSLSLVRERGRDDPAVAPLC
ncbi:hypothetical protein AAKU55_003059 [Oxalobacteraceae bacterium GrIS 1.11]